MRVSYQAFKTENSGIWLVDISVSNMTTEASYSVEDILYNSLAYDTELFVGFFIIQHLLEMKDTKLTTFQSRDFSL